MRTVECKCMSYEFIDTLLFSLVETWDQGKELVERAEKAIAKTPIKIMRSERGEKAKSDLLAMKLALEENERAQDLLRHMTVCGTNRSYADEYVYRNPATMERVERAIEEGKLYPGMEKVLRRAAEREEEAPGTPGLNGNGKGQL